MSTIARNLRQGLPVIAGMIVFSASTLLVSAAEMADPGRQGDMFKRIFSYDKDLRGAERIVIIVVGESRGPELDKVAAVFRERGFFPAVVAAPDLSDDLTSTLTPQSAVLYVMPAVAYDAVKEFAEKQRFLSISGVTSLAEAGHVAVSVDVQGGKPEIVVNIPRLTTERHELSSELLNLARVIR